MQEMSRCTPAPGLAPAMGRRFARALMLIVAFGMLLAGCTRHDEQPPAAPATPPPMTSYKADSYNADSWKTLIPAACERYSDGCNLCNRNADSGMTACTRKACPSYERPECLDEVNTRAANGLLGTLVYRCSGGQRFAVTGGDYRADDQRVQLREDQLMLSDPLARTATLLTRVTSASGVRYKGDDLELWSKGNEAMLMRGGVPLYWNCVHP